MNKAKANTRGDGLTGISTPGNTASVGLVDNKLNSWLEKVKQDAKGALFQGTMYLVAEQIALPKDADEVIFHEFVGHFSLRGFFGGQFRPAFDLIHINNPLARNIA